MVLDPVFCQLGGLWMVAGNVHHGLDSAMGSSGRGLGLGGAFLYPTGGGGVLSGDGAAGVVAGCRLDDSVHLCF